MTLQVRAVAGITGGLLFLSAGQTTEGDLLSEIDSAPQSVLAHHPDTATAAPVN
jgi:hypothetical protein